MKKSIHRKCEEYNSGKLLTMETARNSPAGENFVFIFVFLDSPLNFDPENGMASLSGYF